MSKNTFENTIETISAIDLEQVCGGDLQGLVDVARGAAIGARGAQSAQYFACMDSAGQKANTGYQQAQTLPTVEGRMNKFNQTGKQMQLDSAGCAGQYPL